MTSPELVLIDTTKDKAGKTIHRYAHPAVNDPDGPDESKLAADNTMREFKSAEGRLLGVYRVTEAAIEVRYDYVPPKGETVTGSLTLQSVDGTRATIPIAVTGGNRAAAIKVKEIWLDENDRLAELTPEQGNWVRDKDKDENRFAKTDWQDLELKLQSKTSMTGVQWRVDDSGQIVFNTQKLGAMGAADVASGEITVSSADGSATRTVPVNIRGQNDPAQIEGKITIDVTAENNLATIAVPNDLISVEASAEAQKPSGQKEWVEDADPGENRFSDLAWQALELTLSSGETLAGGRWRVEGGEIVFDTAALKGLIPKGAKALGQIRVMSEDGSAERSLTVEVTDGPASRRRRDMPEGDGEESANAAETSPWLAADAFAPSQTDHEVLHRLLDTVAPAH